MPTPGQKLYAVFNSTVKTVEFVKELKHGWQLLEGNNIYFDALAGSYYETPELAKAAYVTKLMDQVTDFRARQAALESGIQVLMNQIEKMSPVENPGTNRGVLLTILGPIRLAAA